MSRNGKHSFQAEVFELIEQEIGNNNVLPVPTALIQFCGDLEEAAFLSQLIYWSDKGKREDGYIFKSIPEWQAETGLREYTLRKITRKLKKEGLINVKLRQANGTPPCTTNLTAKPLLMPFFVF